LTVLLHGTLFADDHCNVTRLTHSPRIRELDALRGIGAAGVVLYHFTTVFESEYGHAGGFPFHVDVGYYGVHLFFMVSGFVIYMTLERTRGATHFIVSRATRLYPTYWAATLLTFSVVSLAGLAGRERTIWEALANLTMWHEYVGVAHVGGVAWTLSIELAFYAWMYAFWRLGQLAHPLRMFAFWLVVMLLGHGIANTAGVVLPKGITIALLSDYASLFFAGIGFYRWRVQRSPSTLLLILLAFLLEAAQRPGDLLVTAALFGVFALVVEGRLRFLAVRPLLYLCAISYPLYLVHEYIGYIVIRELCAAGWNHPAVILAAPVALAVALAALIHHTIEVPAMRVLRGRFLYRESASRKAPAATPSESRARQAA